MSFPFDHIRSLYFSAQTSMQPEVMPCSLGTHLSSTVVTFMLSFLARFSTLILEYLCYLLYLFFSAVSFVLIFRGHCLIAFLMYFEYISQYFNFYVTEQFHIIFSKKTIRGPFPLVVPPPFFLLLLRSTCFSV